MFPTCRTALLLVLIVLGAACGPPQAKPPPRSPSPTSSRRPSEPTLSPAVDVRAVAVATGVENPEASPDGVVRVSFPRKDVEVVVDGWPLPPFMGVTSWAAFAPARAGVAEAMVMGDLVLFEDEVSAVMSTLLDRGLSVTALHNHFFYDAPRVYFMHIGGEGSVATLGSAVRFAMEKIGEIRTKTPRPVATFGAPSIPAKSDLDGTKIEAVLGVKGQSKDGMFKATIGRHAEAGCGCAVGKTMGVSTWAAFAGSDAVAVVDGDFAVTEEELQPVLKALRAGGIHVVAIHHHMTGEKPRMLFLHYWGKGKAADLAAVVRRALDLTAADKSA
jgi:hypothetical protein